MPDVIAFRGLRFNDQKTGNLDNVITPPYDVINKEERARLAAASPANMVHVLLPQDGPDGTSRYDAASKTLTQWLEDGTIAQDDEPHYYLLRQHFTDLDGNAQVRRGFFATIKLPEAGENFVLGHERTFDKPVEDRLRLTEATQANLGAVFGLYADPDHELENFLAQMDARDADATANTIDGVKQELWCVPADEKVAAFMADKTIYIADGHHRFQTACAYRDAQREVAGNNDPHAHDYALLGFVAFNDSGLAIYPPHRLVAQPEGFDESTFLDALGKWFDITTVDSGLPDKVKNGQGDCIMGIAVHGGGQHLLSLKDIDRVDFLGDDRSAPWRDLDVAILHRGIIENILGIPEGTAFAYEKSVDNAMKSAENGDTGIAFILQPTRAEQICACAEAHEPMPQKSTYFFPKLPSGMVVNRLV